jgi:hypothetical protein
MLGTTLFLLPTGISSPVLQNFHMMGVVAYVDNDTVSDLFIFTCFAELSYDGGGRLC